MNEATERLIDMGDWRGLAFPIYLCAHKGCTVFPRFVGEIRSVNLCKNSLPVHNVFWSFIPENLHVQCCSPEWRGRPVGLEAQGYSPVFSDIYGDGRYVRVYIQANNDVDKAVQIFGTDNNGQPLQERNDEGEWVDGVTITTAKPYGSTSMYVRQIDRLIIDDMEKPISLFAYNATDDILEPIGEYLPGDNNPEFLKYKLTLPACVSCDTTVPLIALIKVKFVPARSGSDLVLIPSLTALKDMVQSIKYSEAGNGKMADYYELKAIRGLNDQLYNKDKENVPVAMGEFGVSTWVGSQQVL